MGDIIIRPFRQEDENGVLAVWNACVDAGDVLYYPLTKEYFERKFLKNDGCEAENLLIAEMDGQIAGFIHGVAPGTFALARPGCAYLTCVMTAPAYRGRGVGKALLAALKARMKARGAHTLYISSLNPVNLDWRIPGTPGHDHNNMPGLDTVSGKVPGSEPVYESFGLPHAARSAGHSRPPFGRGNLYRALRRFLELRI